jgi:hypothetical protein
MAPMGALQFGNHNFVSIAACCVVTAQHESAGQRLSVTRYASSGGARSSAGDQTPGDGKRPKTRVPESSIETSAGPIAVVWWGRLVKREASAKAAQQSLPRHQTIAQHGPSTSWDPTVAPSRAALMPRHPLRATGW